MGKNDYKYDYENIISNPDDDDEKYFAENGRPMIALRLYNFITDVAEIIPNHRVGIYHYIFIPLRSQIGYWINIVGYASKSGGRDYNYELSLRRCIEVQKEIISGKNRLYVVDFKKTIARGSDASPDAYNDDFGYWRSVKIYAHKGSPPPRIEPRTLAEPAVKEQHFAIRMLGGQSLSLFKYLGRDEYAFQIKSLDKPDARCFIYRGTAGSIGLPGSPVSISGSSDWVPFTTYSLTPLAVSDFDDALIGLGQEPGLSAGSTSMRGNFYLDFGRLIDNTQFFIRETTFKPPVITISSNTGAGFSLGLTRSAGRIRLTDCPKDPLADWA